MVRNNVKVMIAVPTADFARRADFYDHLGLIDKSGIDCIEGKVHGQSPARNRNYLIKGAIEHGCTHIFFIDDDVLVPPDSLKKLLAHDLDMVTGLYLMRSYPHQPIIFDRQNEDGHVRWIQLSPDKDGLIEVVSGGLGCCLIKLDVFKQMEYPWIRLGEIKGDEDHWGDDIGFFKRAIKAGFKLHCDLTIKCGHIVSSVLWPTKTDQGWFTTYDTAGTGSITVPGYWDGVTNGNS